ncbi:MAG: C-terminal helicase domain-containing protein, partial [Limnobacter sp.]|nr:C-terminal helicase domain-containing protein [Limnobacter sp.]
GQPEIDQAVIFTSTQQDAEKLARDLGDTGHRVCALHGAMPQNVRNRRLNSIRKGDVKILVATDVAARGLDVPSISHVFNFGMPMKAEDYVHRIGRTGRAGRSGVAVTLAGIDDRAKIRAIEKFINASIPVGVVEGLEPRPMPERSASKPSNRRPKQGRSGDSAGFEGRRSWGKPDANRTRSRPAQEVKPANERRRADSGKPSFSAKAPSRKPVRSSEFNSDRGRGGFVRKRG